MANVIGVFTNCYGHHGVREAVAGAANAGLKYIELAMQGHEMGGLEVPASAVIGEHSSEEDIESFAAHLKAHGVRVITALGVGDLEKPEEFEANKRRMEIAHRLGARTFVLACPSRSETVFARLRELGDFALGTGLLLTLETHPPLVSNAEVGLETMRRVNHRNVRINFDTANLHYYNRNLDTVAELEKLLDYIGSVHLKDSRQGYEEWFFPALGEGTIDFPALFATLAKAGFHGPFSLELEGVGGEGRLPLEKYQERVANSVEYLKGIGVYS